MSFAERLDRSFFDRPTLEVARDVLGMRLVRIENGQRLSGVITEAEAYIGESDLGCHAHVGRTPRTQVMYGPPGHAYVYFTYGMHWMLNFVTEREGFPAAVLIRALHPLEGLETIAARRAPQPPALWTDGPAKITKALNIHRLHNGIDLCDPQAEIFVEIGTSIPDQNVTNSPRVGLNSVPEPWKSIPWRFVVKSFFDAEHVENAEKEHE